MSLSFIFRAPKRVKIEDKPKTPQKERKTMIVEAKRDPDSDKEEEISIPKDKRQMWLDMNRFDDLRWRSMVAIYPLPRHVHRGHAHMHIQRYTRNIHIHTHRHKHVDGSAWVGRGGGHDFYH